MIGKMWQTLAKRAMVPALVLLAVTAEAHAQAPQVPTQVVERASFQVRVIEATKGTPSVDPKLADLERELRSLHRDYARFTLIKTESQNLTTGTRGTLRLPNGELVIQFLGLSPDKAQRVRHRVEMPGMNATVRAVAPGGRTLDVLQLGDKLIIVATTVGR